ncbi:MAG: hypothetical protein GY765_15325 [bacterium]|nr:hypothetical protein [bacterium]
MALWRVCNDKWKAISFANNKLGADVYLCGAGPSLAQINNEDLHVPGAYICAINNAITRIKPHVWVGMDKPHLFNKNLWYEMFRKICRGSFNNEKVNGVPIKYFPETYFADIEAVTDVGELFQRRGHNTKFVWHKHTLGVALHYLIWIGARRIHCLGFDLGGDSDYHDGRVLPDKRRAYNRRLYKQQADYLRLFKKHADKHKIEIISCTPGSPINNFLPYKPLENALADSRKTLPVL